MEVNSAWISGLLWRISCASYSNLTSWFFANNVNQLVVMIVSLLVLGYCANVFFFLLLCAWTLLVSQPFHHVHCVLRVKACSKRALTRRKPGVSIRSIVNYVDLRLKTAFKKALYNIDFMSVVFVWTSHLWSLNQSWKLCMCYVWKDVCAVINLSQCLPRNVLTIEYYIPLLCD